MCTLVGEVTGMLGRGPSGEQGLDPFQNLRLCHHYRYHLCHHSVSMVYRWLPTMLTGIGREKLMGKGYETRRVVR